MPVPSRQLQQARQHAMLAAMREHEALGIDFTKRIDIFRILEQSNIWTMFQPLDSLYGAYVSPQEGVHGVLINVKHPIHLQRFTAAHEYAHYRLHHGPRTDSEEHILSSRQFNLQEIEAQSFAAHFLMPLPLINRCLHQMGYQRNLDTLTPLDAYRLSLHVGVSYTAVVNHLASHKRISSRVAAQLQHTTPKAIKHRLSGGQPPQNSWADVWALSLQDTGSTIILYVDDEIHLSLPEDPEQATHWQLLPQETQMIVELINASSELQPSVEEGKEHAFRYSRHFVLRARVPGSIMLQLENKEHSQQPFRLTVEVLARHPQGLYNAQQRLIW